jgi:hypothetical protein
MPFIRQVRQIGKPGGAALGRVFPVDTIANQFHVLENRYMIGSGVGAVSSSNRRALMRRAYRHVPQPPFVPTTPGTLSAFTVPSIKKIGNANFYPTALPVPAFPYFGTGAITYSSSNIAVATIDATSGLITIVGVGTVTFVASQVADERYISATIRSNTMTISVISYLDAPTAVSGVGGDTVGYIIFTEPSAVGKPAITNYEYSIGGSDFVALSPAQTFSPIIIPGLTNGTTYTAKIRAVNSDGAGAESVDSSAFVPGTNTLYGTSRLVRLEAGNSSSYGGSGTAWTNLDSAGSYSATLQNAPTYQSATTPKYLSFNGTNQIAEIASAPAINATVGSNFTLQIWAKVNTTSPNFSAWDGLISKQSNLNTYDGYSLSLSSSTTINLNMNGLSKNDSYGPLVSNAYSGNVWALYTIVVRYGGGSANPSLVYVNGRLVVTGNNDETGHPAAAPLQFPRGIQEGATNFAPADVGAFYVYNTALSQETIIKNFDATKAIYGV